MLSVECQCFRWRMKMPVLHRLWVSIWIIFSNAQWTIDLWISLIPCNQTVYICHWNRHFFLEIMKDGWHFYSRRVIGSYIYLPESENYFSNLIAVWISNWVFHNLHILTLSLGNILMSIGRLGTFRFRSDLFKLTKIFITLLYLHYMIEMKKLSLVLPKVTSHIYILYDILQKSQRDYW